MDILLDTNLILIYSRDSEISRRIEEDYNLFSDENNLSVSVVTLGEIDALLKKLGIGYRRSEKIKNTLYHIAKVKLNYKQVWRY